MYLTNLGCNSSSYLLISSASALFFITRLRYLYFDQKDITFIILQNQYYRNNLFSHSALFGLPVYKNWYLSACC